MRNNPSGQSRFAHALAAVAVTSLFLARPAHAYLDLGSGSYMLQILIGSVLGCGFAVKMYWKKLLSFFSRSTPQTPETAQQTNSSAPRTEADF